MLRLAEAALFLTPLAAFVVWRLTVARGGPSPMVLLLSACALVVLIAALIHFSRHDALDRGQAYVPAQLRDGRVVPGHAAQP